eukprot:358308-Chlamydomonas_euryale.AAC.12
MRKWMCAGPCLPCFPRGEGKGLRYLSAAVLFPASFSIRCRPLHQQRTRELASGARRRNGARARVRQMGTAGDRWRQAGARIQVQGCSWPSFGTWWHRAARRQGPPTARASDRLATSPRYRQAYSRCEAVAHARASEQADRLATKTCTAVDNYHQGFVRLDTTGGQWLTMSR